MTTVLRPPPVSSRRSFLKFLGAGAGVAVVGGFEEAEGMAARKLARMPKAERLRADGVERPA